MSDRSWAQICIGGTLKRDKVRDFMAEVWGYFGWDLSHQGSLSKEDLQNTKKLVAWIKKEAASGTLTLEDAETSGGNFEDLQRYCRETGLPYKLTHAACAGAWGAGEVWWAPGMSEPVSVATDDDGTSVISVPSLQEAISAVKTLSLENAPLYVNDEDDDTRAKLAKHILETAACDPIALLEYWLKETSPEPIDVPALIIE